MLDRASVSLRVSSLHRVMGPSTAGRLMFHTPLDDVTDHHGYTQFPPQGAEPCFSSLLSRFNPFSWPCLHLIKFFFFWYNQAKTLFTGYGDERVRFSPEPTPSAAAIRPKLSSSHPVKLLPLEVLICHFLSDGLPCSSQPWMSSFPMLLLSTALVPSTFISFVRRRHGMICKAVHCW